MSMEKSHRFKRLSKDLKDFKPKENINTTDAKFGAILPKERKTKVKLSHFDRLKVKQDFLGVWIDRDLYKFLKEYVDMKGCHISDVIRDYLEQMREVYGDNVRRHKLRNIKK